MFILIPFIILFLLYSIIALNDLSQLTEIIIYILMALTISVSILIAKKVKQDMKQQEINSQKIEIYELEQKLHTIPEKEKEKIIHKIDTLKNELDTFEKNN